jgi:hypothetical protein
VRAAAGSGEQHCSANDVDDDDVLAGQGGRSLVLMNGAETKCHPSFTGIDRHADKAGSIDSSRACCRAWSSTRVSEIGGNDV